MKITRSQISNALDAFEESLNKQPSWKVHPVNATKNVSAHRGPVILSEHDCVMHFAKALNDEGVPWDHMHFELSPGQWLFPIEAKKKRPPRVDLAICDPVALDAASPPCRRDDFQFEYVFEFKLASAYWLWKSKGKRSKRLRPPSAIQEGIANDIKKVKKYLRPGTGLAKSGYVVVVQEVEDLATFDGFATKGKPEAGDPEVRILNYSTS